MIAYQTVVELADQLPAAEKARLIEHLSVALRHTLEADSSPRSAWHDSLRATYGILADTPIERPPQPPLEDREPIE